MKIFLTRLHLLLFLVVGLVLGTVGCSTTSRDPSERLPTVIKLAAYVGSAEGLRAHPEYRPAVELAVASLKQLESDDELDIADIYAIARQLPIKELRSDRATLYITSASILLEELGATPVELDRLQRLRPIVVAFREGLELGLAARD